MLTTLAVKIGQPVMMVMEYCEHGSLQAYLRSNDLLPEEVRTQIALDAALGLEYLSSRGW